MKFRPLLVTTAAFEIGTGIALICFPSTIVKLIVGSSLDSPAGSTVSRVAGAAVLSLGVACWLARLDARSGAAKGLVAAMREERRDGDVVEVCLGA
jgi:hypothetical protein